MMAGPDRAHRRLGDLYEISKLFASFEDVEQTFVPVLDIATRTLPLRSAILMEAEAGGSKMNVWPADGRDSEQMRAVKEHVAAAYAHLVRASSTESPALTSGWAWPRGPGPRPPTALPARGSSSSPSSWPIARLLAPSNWKGPSRSTRRIWSSSTPSPISSRSRSIAIAPGAGTSRAESKRRRDEPTRRREAPRRTATAPTPRARATSTRRSPARTPGCTSARSRRSESVSRSSRSFRTTCGTPSGRFS